MVGKLKSFRFKKPKLVLFATFSVLLGGMIVGSCLIGKRHSPISEPPRPSIVEIKKFDPGRDLISRARGAANDSAKAKKHSDKADALYRTTLFSEAVKEYERAYFFSQSPTFLFNLAQSYHYKGEHEKALSFYRAFLNEVPDSPMRSSVNEIIARLERSPSSTSIELVNIVPEVPEDETQAKRLSKQHYARGEKLYNRGRFYPAARAYQLAYIIYPSPEFLFNMGQCLRQAYEENGRTFDKEGALFVYRMYLRTASASDDRTKAKQLVRELESTR